MSRWVCAREGGEVVEVRGVFFFFLKGGGGRLGGAGWSMVDAPRSSIKSIPRSEKERAGASLPSVVLDHVSQLDDELSLFVLLTALKRVLIFPAQGGFTVFTVDISHSM